MKRQQLLGLGLSLGLIVGLAFAAPPQQKPAPGLRVKAAANYEFNGIALPYAVARVTLLCFSALDQSARVEVSVWADLEAYESGKRPIDSYSVSATGAQYQAVLNANAQLWGQMVLGAEGLVLADTKLKDLFESAR